jgi:hypothetical protein
LGRRVPGHRRYHQTALEQSSSLVNVVKKVYYLMVANRSSV